MESSSERKPEVFISFRGEDCRSGFKSHLYAALRRKKIDTYVDDHLRRGEEISPALLRVIQNSKISVIIFTENYASSRWCLDELVKVMECKRNGQIVVPVFYKLDPSDVRHQKGIYADAFDTHENRKNINLGTLQKWRKALWDAANLSGWHSSAFRLESDFIEAIAEDLIRRLDYNSSSDDYTTELVGIDEHIASVESLLFSNKKLMSSKVKIIGLWGMGGIGKTTIAAALYAKLSSHYEGSCFMENVREEWEKLGPNHLRKVFLSKLFEEENIQPFAGPSMGNYFTVKRLQRKRVFIVLDDLNDTRQLDYIVGGKYNYGPGSRIVVTTRDRQVINKADEVYMVHEMDYCKALELFCLFAFEQKYPPMVYTDLAQRVVSFAAGNPLALKVYGSFLYRKSTKEWESALQKLHRIPNMQIMEVLRLSYESLDDHEKNIFLDISCFFKGENKGRIIVLLDGCGLSAEIGLRNLQDKGLITTSSNNEILMHDLIREMGQQIVRENCARDSQKCSRLWDSKDIYYLFRYNLGNEAVEGIFLDMSKIKEVRLNPDALNKMYNLRFLSFRASNDKRCNVQLSGDLSFLPEELRILHWERYPLKSLPSTYCPEKLIELNLSHSRLEKLWDGLVNLPNLRSINLSFSQYLAELPNLSRALSLESIDVEDCTSLCLLPSSIFNIDSLTTINARGCQGLAVLRSDIHLKSLERMNFSGCISLREFSVISENAKFLDLSRTTIKELPPSIGCSSKLIELHLRDCTRLQHIPVSISQLECIEILDLSNCQKVSAEGLFPAVEVLQSLKILKLDNCLSLSKLPDNLSKLSSLNLLSLSACSIESLPPTMKHLSLLKDLVLKDCKRLRHLPELPPSIQRVDASSCISLMIMSNLDSTTQHIQDSFLMGKEELLKQFKGGYLEELMFYDCIKLNKSAVNGLLEGARCRIQRAAFMSSVFELYNILIRISLPGSMVPDWFSLQAAESSVCFQLPADSDVGLKPLRFAFCLLVDTSPWKDDSRGNALIISIGYKCYFPSSVTGKQRWIGSSADVSLTQPSSRKHLCICYDDFFCRDIMDGFGNQSNPEITFEFYANINGANRVKKCGVMVLNENLNRRSQRSRM